MVPDDLSAHKNWHIAGGPGDHFLHRIDLRPAARTRELDVLKQGPNPWAGQTVPGKNHEPAAPI